MAFSVVGIWDPKVSLGSMVSPTPDFSPGITLFVPVALCPAARQWLAWRLMRALLRAEPLRLADRPRNPCFPITFTSRRWPGLATMPDTLFVFQQADTFRMWKCSNDLGIEWPSFTTGTDCLWFLSSWFKQKTLFRKYSIFFSEITCKQQKSLLHFPLTSFYCVEFSVVIANNSKSLYSDTMTQTLFLFDPYNIHVG